jgi:pyridoxamine 5'-phosphate oxidase
VPPPDPTGPRLPPWRAPLTAALHRGRSAPESRYLQLATVSRDGRARNRTVVFRGFGPASEILIFTDRRSAKFEEITHDPRAELCWYLPKTREQFRLLLRCELWGEQTGGSWATLRERAWQDRGARGQAEWLGAIPDAPVPVAPPEFILLSGTVVAAELLELRPDPQRRTRWRVADDDRWHSD